MRRLKVNQKTTIDLFDELRRLMSVTHIIGCFCSKRGIQVTVFSLRNTLWPRGHEHRHDEAIAIH
jgi:hypothetical protein